ncbi:MAG TPA: MFS transporter [Terriglobia bacterium]|nr:MFS transporter [Terriglobia bacterium]
MNPPRQTANKYLMGTACAGLFTFGIMTTFLGATLPELSARLAFGLERSGALFSFLYFPQIPMVFFAGTLIDRFGKKPILAGGFLLSAAAMVGMAYAPSYAVLAGLLVLLGLGGSSAMSASNTLIPDLYPENPSSALNLGGIFFGVGAIFFPSVVTLLTGRLGLVATLWLIAALVAAVAVVALAETFPPRKATGGFDWKGARRMALDPAVIILAWVLFFYSAIEISTAGWIRTYLEQEFQAAPQTSKTILTAFWVMMMVGRLAASQVVKKVRGPRLVLGASVGATIGLVLLAVSPNVAVATAGIVICGLSYAPVFPTTAGTASTYFSKLFGTVFGILMTLALFSGAVVPPAVGYIAQHAGVRSGMWLLAAIALLLLVTQAIFNRYERRRFLSSAPQ